MRGIAMSMHREEASVAQADTIRASGMCASSVRASSAAGPALARSHVGADARVVRCGGRGCGRGRRGTERPAKQEVEQALR
jgi:hypothetical protein